MKEIFGILIFLIGTQTYAIEYICWPPPDFAKGAKGIAFESNSVACTDGSHKEKGSVAQKPGAEKRVVCLVPAACLALSPDVVKIFQDKSSAKSIEEIKKLSSDLVENILKHTPYAGRSSQVICQGHASVKKNEDFKLGLTGAQCPNLTNCANADEVLYGMAEGETKIESPSTPASDSGAVRTVPTAGDTQQ